MVRKVLGFPIYFAVLAEENYPRSRQGGGGGAEAWFALFLFWRGWGLLVAYVSGWMEILMGCYSSYRPMLYKRGVSAAWSAAR